MADGPLHVIELARRTDTGRVRDHNEDRAYAHDELVAVADGMGGAAAGEVAAQLAIRAIRQLPAPITSDHLRDAIGSANGAIRATAASDPTKAGMGTTMTAIAVDNGIAHIAHVGDSRAYLWRDGALVQLTHDHSVVAEMVRQGTLSEDDALHHPHRNVITRALGADHEVDVDISTAALAADDVLMLCSDGLYTEVDHEDIAETMRAGGALPDTAQALVDRANAAGGSDNVTVVLARIGYGPAMTPGPPDASGTTQEYPIVDIGTTQRIPELPAAVGARVLQPVSTGRRARGRTGPLLLVALVILGLIIGGAWWAVTRSFTMQPGPGGTVWVDQGLKIGPLDLTANWQNTGVPTATVRQGPRAHQLGAVSGEGATVRNATTITWVDGIPTVPKITAQTATH